MFANDNGTQRPLTNTRSLLVLISLGLCLFMSVAASAQNNFNSGSTGADGAFAPNTTQTIVVPDSGVFNFTTVNIPAGVTITFNRGTNNKPLTILASGDVLIAGTINVDGKPGNANNTGGLGGPGGGTGGMGGYPFDQSQSGVSGDGPGGGGGGIGSSTISLGGSGGGGGYGTPGNSGQSGTVAGQAGPKFGATTILPLTGGSGGGGGATSLNNTTRGGGGGGGGGAILIASSGTITINGTISARGGNGAAGAGGGGGGAGGAIRLIANVVTGTGNLTASGGGGGGAQVSFTGGAGGQGYIRIEAYDYSGFSGTTTPTNIASLTFPHPVTPPNSPSLRIASVGGINAPATPAGSLQAVPDIIVPAATANPVTVALEASNMPVGTVLQVILTPSRGARTTGSSGPLAGTESASTASASVTLPSGISVISATGVIDLTIAKAKPVFMDGERVNRIEVAATFGGASELTYVTESGRRIRQAAN